MELLATLALAASVFAATNVDDLLLLAIFFADPRMSPRAVVAGQVLGIAALTATSACLALLTIEIPRPYVALLGLAPLALGVRALRRLRASPDDDAVGERRTPGGANQVLAVALVTVANGGDNLGVYVPLFAKEPAAIPWHAGVFLILAFVWCAISRWSVRHPAVGPRLQRFAHTALPFVLIGLGLWILADARHLLA
jgi:cadmium resistance protein CadD (predicted permease)